MPRTVVNLKQSIQTDSPAGTPVYDFKDDSAQPNQNTGIERNGGVANLYVQATAHADLGARYIVADNGKVIEILPAPITDKPDRAVVKIDGRAIEKVSAYGVAYRQRVSGYDDVQLTADGTYIAIKFAPDPSTGNATISVYEFSMAGTLLNSRTIEWAAPMMTDEVIPADVKLVRWAGLSYSDDLEFIAAPDFGSYLTLAREDGLSLVQSILSAPTGNGYRTDVGPIYWFKFENGYYLGGKQGNTANAMYVYDGTNWATPTLIEARWAVIQTYDSKSRAIVTKTPEINGTNIEVIGVVGYTDYSAFSASVVWGTSVVSGTPSSIEGYLIGYNYVELRYKKGTSTIYGIWCPSPMNFDTSFFSAEYTIDHNADSNTFGRLNATYYADGDPHTEAPLQYRVRFVDGVQSYLSVAWSPFAAATDLTRPYLGVCVSAVGEFDPTYCPQVSNTEDTILYRYGSDFYVVNFSTSPTDVFTRIGPNVYRINTISPLSIVDAETETLEIGSTEFNGGVYFTADGTGSASIAFVVRGKYSDSLDTGEKITTTVTSPKGPIVGYLCQRIPHADTRSGVTIDVYYEGEYLWSHIDNGSRILDSSKDGLLYVPSQLLPVPVGTPVENYVAQGKERSYLLAQQYTDPAGDKHVVDGYLVGNDLYGVLWGFSLFGQTYVFDGSNIYLLTFEGSLFSEKVFVAPAAGMTYIASSPTAIFFLSAFDNSIYVFNGGRELIKQVRLSNLEAVTDGVYSVRDNTLLLQTANTLIWVRDDVVSLNAKLSAQTSLKLYDTVDGIVLNNDASKWMYTYSALSGSTVVALTWQSPYLGARGNIRSIAADWSVTLYAATRTSPIVVTLTCESFDEDGYASNAKTVTVKPSDWSALGFVRLRMQPKTQRALASSIKVECSSRVVITDVSVEWGEEGPAITRASRSL